VITVRFFAAAKAATGISQFQVSGSTISEVLNACEQEFPALSSVLPKCSYLLNEVSCIDLTSQVNSGDQLDVLPPFAGG
jgi:molybdopterin converting factor small subunit